MHRLALNLIILFASATTSPALDSGVPIQLPGQRSDGSMLLPNQWSLRPAGQQLALGDFPVNIAVHPKGRYAAVLHCGYSQHLVMIVDLKGPTVLTNAPVEDAFYGIEFNKDGSRLYCSGAASEVIHEYKFADGNLSDHRVISVHDVKATGVPAGIAVGAHELWVANLMGQTVSRVSLETNAVVDIPVMPVKSDTNNAADDEHPASPETTLNRTGAFPYACRLDEKRGRLYVSLWGEASVAVIDLKTQKIIARWPTEEQPNEMLLTRSGKILFVANANRNTVTALDTATGKALETLAGGLDPKGTAGSTPNSLALTPDEKTLFVANADNNNLAVFDVSKPGRSRSLGFIPVGWYPTSVRVTPDGKHILVANGKGASSKANPGGPVPGKKTKAQTIKEYIAQILQGTLSVIDVPTPKQLADYTATAYKCSPLKGLRTFDTRVISSFGELLPAGIKYVFYIIKENRTYDQIFGDMPQGNGDAKLCLFTEEVSPNHHQLARDFVLLDNFYADAEISADGHEWSMGAYATSFVEKIWPMQYGHNKSKKYPYPSEGIFPMATPTGGYLWDRAAEAGVTYRSYGEFVANGKKEGEPMIARVKALRGHIDDQYRGFDLNYPDAKRADRFLSELKRFKDEGDMSRLQIIRFPGDHTSGATLGKRTPTACVADNDVALGRIVDAISHSKFWKETAIFVVEDDAQNGADHVDAHRTVAFVMSPFVKRGTVDSTMYSTSSMLRTIELILGLKPMSQFDAAAMPMANSFRSEADTSPYTALPAKVDVEDKNSKTSWGERESRKMDFSREDAADDLLLNAVIWRAVRGDDSPVPAPTRAGFVFVPAGKDADD